jgi:ABC-3C biological conflict system middle component
MVRMTQSGTLRLWHPSFDAYHCSFRLLRLLVFKKEHAFLVEKLCILDFYVLYPVLLHRASMPNDVRRSFRVLGIARPESQFVQLPSEKGLFREISIYQKAAATNLVAKGLLDREQYLLGTAKLVPGTIPSKLLEDLKETNLKESQFMNFLVNQFGALELTGQRGLRVLTGLVRRRQ